tara:strand:+ start:1206 stop:1907 length:702 start_codon:yes stop_codon:yes gene_type:complete
MQINKAMILAAGYGKRLLPLTTKIPKPLIKIGQKNFLERAIEILIKIGVKEIVINVHYLPEQIKLFLKNYKNNISIKIIEEKGLILDTGGGILNATKNFKDESFYVLNPDTIWSKNYFEELKILENLYYEIKNPVLLLVDKKNAHDKSFKGDFNLNINKLITRDKENKYIFTGAQILNRKIFDGVKDQIFSMNKVWNKLIKQKSLFGLESNQTFFHVNSLDAYKELKNSKFID